MKAQSPNSLVISTSDGYLFINPEEIVYCEADGNYTSIFLISGQRHFICRQLGDLEGDLPGSFVRIHHSYIVNIRFLDRYDHSGLLWLKSGFAVPVARRRRQEVLWRLGID